MKGGLRLTLYRREADGFPVEPIPLELDPNAVPGGVTTAAMDGDSDPNLYVHVFLSGPKLRSTKHDDSDHAKLNILLRNEGGRRRQTSGESRSDEVSS